MINENDDENVKMKTDHANAFYFVCLTFLLIFGVISMPFQPALPQQAYAARFTMLVEENAYIPGESLVIYGFGAANDALLVRVFDSAGRLVQQDSVVTDADGLFRKEIFEWPEPSIRVPFGSYTIEATSSLERTDIRTLDVTFTAAIEDDTGPRSAVTHTLGLKLDSPTQVSVGEPFRIFIQVTFDGALVADQETVSEVEELLGTSHVHSGEVNIPLRDKLKWLHEGLYYADVTLDMESSYIVHASAFYRGLLSHDSKVVTATKSSISSVQESVTELDARLDSTNEELQNLRQGIQETRDSLNQTQSAITSSVADARSSIQGDIDTMRQATGQINSIILPVLALISVIIALQISLFARIRASFR
jgi:hypothetical protein